jgi:hypothetical protein
MIGGQQIEARLASHYLPQRRPTSIFRNKVQLMLGFRLPGG